MNGQKKVHLNPLPLSHWKSACVFSEYQRGRDNMKHVSQPKLGGIACYARWLIGRVWL